MKILHLIVLGGALAYSPVMLADSVSFDPAQLGRMRGILDTCTRVDPRGATAYLLQMKALIGDAKKETVDQAVRTDEYRQAYQSVTGELGNMGQEEMARTCTVYLGSPN